VISDQLFAVIHVLGSSFAGEPVLVVRVSDIYMGLSSGRRWSVLDVPALDMHVGLANRERVNVGRVKVTKTVIDEAVGRFVGANGIQDVLYRRVLGKAPVIFGDGGRCHLLPVPINFFSPNRRVGPRTCTYHSGRCPFSSS